MLSTIAEIYVCLSNTHYPVFIFHWVPILYTVFIPQGGGPSPQLRITPGRSMTIAVILSLCERRGNTGQGDTIWPMRHETSAKARVGLGDAGETRSGKTFTAFFKKTHGTKWPFTHWMLFWDVKFGNVVASCDHEGSYFWGQTFLMRARNHWTSRQCNVRAILFLHFFLR